MSGGIEDRVRERMLDVGLAEVAGVAKPPDVADAVRARLAAREGEVRVRGRVWLTAALVLLGAAATFFVAWEGFGGEGETRHAQDPEEALPPAIEVEDPADAPADVRNLRWVIGDGIVPGHQVRALSRLWRLERFELRGTGRWNRGPVPIGNQELAGEVALPWSVFEIVAEAAPSLHTVVLRDVPLGHRHVEALASAGELRGLTLDGTRVDVDEPLVDALAAIPSLHHLELSRSTFEGESLMRLSRLEGLRSITLDEMAMLSDDGLRAIASLPNLRAFGLRRVDHPLNLVSSRAGMPSPGTLTPELLAVLPDVVEVDLSNNTVDAAEVRALPSTVRRLRLLACWAPPEELADAIIDMPSLEDLEISIVPPHKEPEREERILVAILEGKLLDTLELGDRPKPAVTEALARQDRLRKLTVTWRARRDERPEALDLSFVARLPRLENLTLAIDRKTASVALPETDLAPFADARSLRRLSLPGWPGEAVAEVRAILGERVDVIGGG